MRYFIWFSILFSLLNSTTQIPKDPVPPNIIFILADDLGWSSLSEQMDPKISDSKSDFHLTPNLDRLMKSGVRFTQGYAPASICSERELQPRSSARMKMILGGTGSFGIWVVLFSKENKMENQMKYLIY